MKSGNFLPTVLILFLCLPASTSQAQGLSRAYPFVFVPNATYDPTIPSPDSILGFPLGEKPARYDEVIHYLRILADKSPRVRLMEMGETYEKRKQVYVVVTSEDNQKKLDEIRQRIGSLADPRKLNAETAQAIIATTPAVAWIGYGIHGDELSSTDASLQVMYQLAAGTDSTTLNIVREMIVCIDPMENPDGRERFLAQTRQWAGTVVNSDAQSMHHGVWPYGRGNHYLFDLNRDWFTLTQVENQVRIPAILGWNPQLLIDSHEMGAYDTYLFYPPRQPINPNVSEYTKKWWKVFAADQARAFDRYGWSYYTREWSDEWFPGYGSSWSLYIDAVGILYEQAGTDGSLVKRPDGTTLTFHESVHHHIVSSMANLTTAARNRKDLLVDYWTARRNGIAFRKDEPHAFYFVPGKNPSRVELLIEKLLMQNIEVNIAEKPFQIQDAHDYWGSKPAVKKLPAGTYLVSLDQPMARLAKAILEFDPRMTTATLEEERKSLEKDKDSRMYDVMAWSLPLAYGIEAYWSDRREHPPSTPVKTIPRRTGNVHNPHPQYGFLMDYSDDRAVDALVMIFARGCVVRSARDTFSIEGRSYPRGTILLRVRENPASLADNVRDVALAAGVDIYGVNTALSTGGPDLGGNDFVLLTEPRIAILAGPAISTSSVGSLWHLLDYRLTHRISLLYADQIGFTDLEKYNVILLPSGRYRDFGKAALGKLKEWATSGGTLIGIGSAASFLADTSTGASEVKLRQHVLKDLDLYTKSVDAETRAHAPVVDSLSVWEGKTAPKDTSTSGKTPAATEKELTLADEQSRLFMPRGAIMRINLDDEHWLAYGAGDRLPAIFYSADAFLSKDPVQTPARFSDYEHLRLSGLLWPEGRARWARTAYATREGKGKGQLILFTGEPNFRACFFGTERLLLNSIFLGPGFGTEHPVEW